jgi:hypothetical protein
MPTPHPDWLRTRARLHDRLEAVAGLGDAAWLGTLHGGRAALSEDAVAELWRSAPAHAQTHLYVHVPFCKSICSFCNYERLRPSSPDQLQAWLARVLQSIRTLAPATRHLTFHSLYVGGGTPSVLPAPMLDTVLTAIDEAFAWHPRAGRHFELDPQVVSASRVAVLREHGVLDYSFGIQTLDVGVNRAHNRGEQDRAAVRRCLDLLAGAGSVHCDFLLGLQGTAPEAILAEVDSLMGPGGPDSIDLYALQPTAHYLERHWGGDRARFEAHMAPFRTAVAGPLRALAARHGWLIEGTGRHSFKLVRALPPEGAPQRFGYTQLAHVAGHPMNLLGLGPSARSRVFGQATLTAQAPAGEAGPHTYSASLGGLPGELQVFVAHALRDADRLDLAEVGQLFGDAGRAALATPLAAWTALGRATVEGDTVVLAPEDAPARVRTLLWLVPTAHLEHELARRQGLDIAGTIARARLPADGPWRIVDRAGPRLTLARGPDRVRLRLAPSLDTEALRWVVETGGDHARDPGLRRAVGLLRRQLPGPRGRQPSRSSAT